MTTNVMKILLNKISEGKLSDSLVLIEEKVENGNPTCQEILSILSACITYAGSGKKLDHATLLSIKLAALKNLNITNESDFTTFLKLIYHSIKYFLSTKKCDVIQEFLHNAFNISVGAISANQEEIYSKIIVLLYNACVQIRSNKSEWWPVSDYIPKICTKLTKPAEIVNVTGKYLMVQKWLQNDSDTTIENFAIMQNVLGKNIKQLDETIFVSHFGNVTSIIELLIKKNDFSPIPDIISKSKSIFPEDKYTCCHELLQLCLALIKDPLNLKNSMTCFSKIKLRKDSLESISKNLINTLRVLAGSYQIKENTQAWCNLPSQNKIETFQVFSKIILLNLGSNNCNCKSTNQTPCNLKFFWRSLYVLSHLCASQCKKMDKQIISFLLSHIRNYLNLCKKIKCDQLEHNLKEFGKEIHELSKLITSVSSLSLDFIKELVKLLIGTDLRLDCLQNILQLLIAELRKYKKHEDCMASCALMLYFYPENKDTMMYWLKSKLELKESDKESIQTVTLITAFDQFNSFMESINFNFEKPLRETKVKMLKLELDSYRNHWPSKLPMMICLKELQAFATPSEMIDIIAEVFGDVELSIHEEVPRIINDCYDAYKKGGESINLAIVLYLKYTFKMQQAVQMNKEDVEKVEKIKIKINNEHDPSEEYDLAQSYKGMKLDQYLLIQKYLDRSLEMFSKILRRKDVNAESFNYLKPKLLYKLLLKISFEYGLHMNKEKRIRAVELAYSLAKLEESVDEQLECLGILLELYEQNQNYVRELLRLGDDLGDKVKDDRIISLYRIGTIKALMYVDGATAWNLLHEALGTCERFEENEDFIFVRIQFLVIKYRFDLMPCNLGFGNGLKNDWSNLYMAYTKAVKAYGNSKFDKSYRLLQILEIVEELVQLFHQLKLSRDVKAYCKYYIDNVLENVLPLRYAKLLIYFSHSDLRSGSFDNCYVKLDCLSEALSLNQTKHKSAKCEKPKPIKKQTRPESIEHISSQLREMVLDSATSRRDFNPCSARYEVDAFQLPEFFSHSENCVCLCCTSIEFLQFVLLKTHLDAIYSKQIGNVANAIVCFKGLLEMYNLIEGNFKLFIGKMRTEKNFIGDFKQEFASCLVPALIDFRNLKVSEHNLTGMEEINKIINDFSLLVNGKNYHLTKDLIISKIRDLFKESETDAKSANPSLEDSKEELVLPVTPESKSNTVLIPHENNEYLAPPKKGKRVIKLKLTEDQDSIKKEKPVRSRRDNSENAKTKILSEELKESVKKKNEGIVNHSENAILTDNLKMKTKLLTEKLKSTSKKMPDVEENLKVDDRLKRSKNNLFETNPKSVVRKSARNKN